MAKLSLTFFSEALQTTTHAEVVFPSRGVEAAPVRVLYLLHGMYGACTDWTENTRITHYANRHGFIVVMPEVQNSFYTDMAYGGQYFTYVAHELPKKVEYLLNVKHTRANTYVAGLSMGGYGAMKIGLSRPEFFTACAAFSGSLDAERIFKALPEVDAFRKKLAVAIAGPELIVPAGSDLFTLSSALADKAEKPRVLVTCGHEDFLIEANRKFDAHMKTLPFEYEYKEWPGAHDWDFWEECLPVMFAFFNRA